MYKFEVVKSVHVSEEDFNLALVCAKGCVEERFGGRNIVVSIANRSIEIDSSVGTLTVILPFDQCKKDILKCFGYDRERGFTLYEQFEKILPSES